MLNRIEFMRRAEKDADVIWQMYEDLCSEIYQLRRRVRNLEEEKIQEEELLVS